MLLRRDVARQLRNLGYRTGRFHHLQRRKHRTMPGLICVARPVRLEEFKVVHRSGRSLKNIYCIYTWLLWSSFQGSPISRMCRAFAYRFVLKENANPFWPNTSILIELHYIREMNIVIEYGSKLSIIDIFFDYPKYLCKGKCARVENPCHHFHQIHFPSYLAWV